MVRMISGYDKPKESAIFASHRLWILLRTVRISAKLRFSNLCQTAHRRKGARSKLKKSAHALVLENQQKVNAYFVADAKRRLMKPEFPVSLAHRRKEPKRRIKRSCSKEHAAIEVKIEQQSFCHVPSSIISHYGQLLSLLILSLRLDHLTCTYSTH